VVVVNIYATLDPNVQETLVFFTVGIPNCSFSAEELQKAMYPFTLHGGDVPITGVGKSWC